MNTTIIAVEDFDADASRAQKAADVGPVIITEHGQSAYVLISIEEYRRLSGNGMSIAEALAQSDSARFRL